MANGDGIVQLGKSLDVGERTIAHVDKASEATRAALAQELPTKPKPTSVIDRVKSWLGGTKPVAAESANTPEAAAKAKYDAALAEDVKREAARTARENARVQAQHEAALAKDIEREAARTAREQAQRDAESPAGKAAAKAKYDAALADDIKREEARKVSEDSKKMTRAWDKEEMDKIKAAEPKPVSQLTPQEKAARIATAKDTKLERQIGWGGDKPISALEDAKQKIDKRLLTEQAQSKPVLELTDAERAARIEAAKDARAARAVGDGERPLQQLESRKAEIDATLKAEAKAKLDMARGRATAGAAGVGAIAGVVGTAMNGGSAGDMAQSATTNASAGAVAGQVFARTPGHIAVKAVAAAVAGSAVYLGVDKAINKMFSSDPQAPGAGPNGPQPAVGPVLAPAASAAAAAQSAASVPVRAATPASGAASSAPASPAVPVAAAASAAPPASAPTVAPVPAPAPTPASPPAPAPAPSTDDGITIKRGDMLTKIADSRDADMKVARAAARAALGGKPHELEVLHVLAITMAKKSIGIEDINKIEVGQKVAKITADDVTKVIEELKGLNKITSNGHLKLEGKDAKISEIFAPSTPAAAAPAATGPVRP